MQIVIDIPEKLACEGFERPFTEEEKNILIKAIGNGTPLPKGHGRLIDGDELESHMKIGYNIVKSAPTIIEAESDHKCHTCKHYMSGEHDGSCDSYVCEHYSDWESEDKG